MQSDSGNIKALLIVLGVKSLLGIQTGVLCLHFDRCDYLVLQPVRAASPGLMQVESFFQLHEASWMAKVD